MKWISLDLGATTGFAEWLGDEYINSKPIKFKGKFDGPQGRLQKFHRFVHSLLFPKEGHRPGLIAVETPAGTAKFWKGIGQLNQKLGVLKVLCYQVGVEVVEIYQKEVKQRSAGKGNASKKQVTDAVNVLLDLDITDHNEADAVAVGLAYMLICEEAEACRS